MLTAAAFIAGAAWYHARMYVNHDAGWLLHMARASLHGAVLYRDLIEINPPLVIWLLYPVVQVSELTGVSLDVVFNVAIGVLALGTIACTLWLLDPEERWAALPLLALACFVAPAGDFGQREHLLVLLLLPYLALVARRAGGSTVPAGAAALIGVAAAIGFALKPHFGVIWIGMALYLASRLGLRRFLLLPETVVAVAAAPTYILAVTLLTPAYWTVLHQLGPVYRAFLPRPAWVLLLQPAAMAALLGAGLWSAVRWRMDHRALRDVLAIAAFGAALGAVVAGKGVSLPLLAGADVQCTASGQFDGRMAAIDADGWRPAGHLRPTRA